MQEYLVDDPKVREKYPFTCYDLVANISHDGEPGKNSFWPFKDTTLQILAIFLSIIIPLK